MLLSGGASALMAVPADGMTLDDKRATTDAAAAGRRRHPRAQHRPQAPVRDQGRPAGGGRRAAPTLHAGDFRRRRRRPERDRVGPDGRRCAARSPTRSTCSTRSAARDRIPPSVVAHLDARRARRDRRDAEAGDPRLARAARRDRQPARRDGGRRRGGARARLSRRRRSTSRSSAKPGPPRRRTSRRAGGGRRAAAPVCASSRAARRRSRDGTRPRRAQPGVRARGRRRAWSRSPGAAALASVGTDGIDGPTDAAGALVDSTTLARAQAAGPVGRHDFSTTTMPTRFSTRSAISSTPVRPAPTSATSR